MQVNKNCRKNRKDIHEDEQDLNFGSGDEMISQCLQDLFFLIPEIYGHPKKLGTKNKH